MPIFMSCPSCGRPGNLPDSFKGGRVTCPGCGTVTNIPAPKAEAPRTSASGPRTAPAATSRPKPARPKPQYDDLDGLEEAEDQAPAPAMRPSPGTRMRPGQAPAAKSPMPIIAAIGGGGAFLLAVIIALFAMNRAPEKAAPPRDDHVVVERDSTPTPAPVTPPAPSPSTSSGSPYSSQPTEAPAELIRRIKDATVYIKVSDGKSRSSGSGFVIRVEGDRILIGTNRHVISHGPGDDDDDDEESSPGAAPKGDPKVSVVFRSGENGQEQEVPATILGKDSTGENSRDLAILEVRGVTRAPRPIELSRATQPSEGMDLKIYGFPFGQIMNSIARSGGNPAITVNKASVSSLRRDDLGHLSLIQIDGSVNPGNSGGPIVDDKGQLIGVTVAKLKIAENVGLAIPVARVEELLQGRVGHFELERVSGASGLEFVGRAQMDDPMGKLRSVSMSIAPLNGPPPKAVEGSVASQAIANARPFNLTLDRNAKLATGRGSVSLPADAKQVLVQISYTAGDGRTFLSSPQAFDLPQGIGRLVPVGGRAEEMERRFRGTKKKLGPLQDPDKDCKLAFEGPKIKITVPGKLHTLAPQIVDKKNKAIKNAPMTLAKVDGDFLIHVRVTGDMRPGASQLKHPKTGKDIGLTFQGAGIVLWQDQDNYIRLERTCGTAGGPTLVTRLLVEVVQGGREAGRPYYIDVPEGAMALMMVRKGGATRCLFSNDGKRWAMLREIAADFPAKIQVGLLAVNISKNPYTAQFEDFALLDDRDKIAEGFDSSK